MENSGQENQDQSESGSDGSVWTSYSDLFTTMAIIFLVMFVFALIKSSVTSVKVISEKKKTKEYYDGKVQPEKKKEWEARNQEIVNSMKLVSDVQQELDSKAKYFSQVSKDLQKGREKIHEVVKQMGDQQIIIENLNQKVLVQETAANKLQNNLKTQILRSKAQEKELTESIREQQKLKKVVDQHARASETLENELKKKNQIEKKLLSRIDHNKKSQSKIKKDLEKTKQYLLLTQNQNQVLEQKLKDKSIREQNFREKIKKIENENHSLNSKIKEKENDEFMIQAELKKVQDKSNSQINNLQKKIASLVSNVKDSNNQNIVLRGQVKELSKSLEQKTKETNNLKNIYAKAQKGNGELQGKLEKSEELNSELAAINGKLRGSLKNFKDQVGKLSGSNDSLVKELGLAQDGLKKAKGKIKGLNQALASSKNLQGQFKSEIGKLKGENDSLANKLGSSQKGLASAQGQVAELKGELQRANGKQNELEAKTNGLKKENTKLVASLLNLKKENSSLGDDLYKLKLMSSNYSKKNKDLESKFNSCLGTSEEIEKKYNSCKSNISRIGRGIASVEQQLRKNVAKEIAELLKKEDIDVKLNMETGTVTLMMDDVFLYQRNSSNLSDKAKEVLKKIIPIYSKVLFEKSDLKKNIASVDVIGHASPTFRRTFVDPENPDFEAYAYNLGLSTTRASQMTQFIVGKGIGEFNFQNEMRKKIQAIGKSFSEPILASKNENLGCGKYDCKLSRRVEIGFSLKRNSELYRRIKKMNLE